MNLTILSGRWWYSGEAYKPHSYLGFHMAPLIEAAVIEQAPKMNGNNSTSISFSPFLPQKGSVGGICCENWWVLCCFFFSSVIELVWFYLARKVGRLEILLSSRRKSSFPVRILSSCRLLCYLLRKKENPAPALCKLTNSGQSPSATGLL